MTGSSRSKPVVEWARRLGCDVSLSRNGHYKVRYRGRLVAVMASTPSDRRASLNAEKQILRNVKRIKKEKAWQARS